jgi:FAD/FMN-containing dehydrogenase
MNEIILRTLKECLGKGNVFDNTKTLARYIAQEKEADNFVVVTPESTEDVQKIVKIADKNNTPVLTADDGALLSDSTWGIIIDFNKMNKIEFVDAPNLMAHIQRGVTFDQLTEELKKFNLKPAYPVGVFSDYVVPAYVNRSIILAAQKFPETQFSNLLVVLADGTIHKTGSHALSEEIADWRDEPGPHISKWYHASNDIYGIITRASILVYPNLEQRDAMVAGFTKMADLLSAMKEISRKELCIECIGMNRTYLKQLTGHDSKQSEWFLVVGFESTRKHVEFQRRNCEEIVKKYSGSEINALQTYLLTKLHEPWKILTHKQTYFYTLFNHTEFFDKIISDFSSSYDYPNEKITRLFISYGNGRAVYCNYSFLTKKNFLDEMVEKLDLKLLDEGVFFDNPQGKLAEELYSRTGNYLKMMKRIKKIVDPKNILNPGIPVSLI